jgi:hypothetical protein
MPKRIQMLVPVSSAGAAYWTKLVPMPTLIISTTVGE